MENKNFENQPEKTSTENRIQKLLDKREQLYNKDLLATHSEIINFSNHLMGKYTPGKCQEYASYHALIGSTPGKNWSEFPADKIDFPGEDSIEKLLERLEEKYRDK